jgi:hypothetical protein
MMPNELRIGTIVGQRSGCIVIQVGGEEALCRGLLDLHRVWGFYNLPVGQKVKISQTSGKRPKIVEVLSE